MDEQPASHDLQKPIYEPAEPATGSTEGSRVSSSLENPPQPATANGRDDPTEAAEPGAFQATRLEVQIARLNSPSDAFDGKALDQAEALPEEDPVAVAPVQSRIGIRANFTDEEIEAILRPRVLGSKKDSGHRDEATEGVDARRIVSAKTQDLDPITVVKLLWAYADFSPGALARLGHSDKELYAKAVEHPRAVELREALVRGISNHRQASRDAELAQVGLQRDPAHLADQKKAGGAAHQLQVAWHAQQGRGRI